MAMIRKPRCVGIAIAANSPSPTAVMATMMPEKTQAGLAKISQMRSGIATAAVASLVCNTKRSLSSRRRGRWRRRALGDPTEATLPQLELAQRFEELPFAEVRPQRLGDVDLRVGDLPQQKVRETHLATRPDQEVGIGDSGGAEALRDRVLVDGLRRDLPGLHAGRDLLDGDRDLRASAVRQRQDHREAGVVLRR